jgi:hypothetical protein
MDAGQDVGQPAPPPDSGFIMTVPVDASPPPPPPPPPKDAAPPPPPVGYPAPHPSAPQVENGGGPSMSAPQIIPIVFQNDSYQPDIAKFTAGIGTTGASYWGVADEYGVGPATALPVVVVTDTIPTAIDDTTIATWLVSKVTTAVLPPPTPNTIYTVFYPEQTTITLQGAQSCVYFGGYHNSSTLANGTPFAYAIVPRCPQFDPVLQGIDEVTGAASHELMEAATDPLPENNPAWSQLDPDHLVWSFLGAEVGDMCAQNPDAFFKPQSFPYDVQRIWSNKAAINSHDPCVPSAPGPYFNSVPVLNDTITLNLGGQTASTKGALIPVGQSKTIEVDLFSDAPTSGPWQVSAMDITPQLQMAQGQTLSFSFDTTSGQNGDKLKLTISAEAAGMYGIEVFLITSTLGGATRLWLGAVGN